MKEILNALRPEISPVHKIDFSIAAQLVASGARTEGAVIPAGTLLTGDFLADPVTNKAIPATATGAELTGVLLHDVVLEAGTDLEYSVGVMIKGVVYDDVIKSVNAWYVDADRAKLYVHGIVGYGAKTLKA